MVTLRARFNRILGDAHRAGAEVFLDRTNDCLVVRGPNNDRLAGRLEQAMDVAKRHGVMVVANATDATPTLVFLSQEEVQAAAGDLRTAYGSLEHVYLDGTVNEYDRATDATARVHDVCGHGFMPTHDEFGNG
jgi:hypothetical protein